MALQRALTHTETTNLADLLERILDKGIMIAGDIRVNLVEVELLTIRLRLVLCSLDKAREIGMNWWANDPAFCAHSRPSLKEPARQEPGLAQGRTAGVSIGMPRARHIRKSSRSTSSGAP